MEITGNVNSRRLPLKAIAAMFKSTKQNDPQEYFIGDKEMPEEQGPNETVRTDSEVGRTSALVFCVPVVMEFVLAVLHNIQERCRGLVSVTVLFTKRLLRGMTRADRSHDSFSFYIDEASPVGPEQPETVQNFVSVFGTVAKKLLRKWLATQTMNFTSQLGAGIRYFDLRISTKPRDPDNELYFAHGLFSAKVKEGLEEINAFLADHPKEVVFLDFNHFYGMQKYHHEKLVQMLKDTYGNKMCPAIFAHEVSLQYLWEKEHQVLVFYHSPVALEVPFLWPGQMMPAPWANTTDPEKLIQFLQASITERRKKGSFFISQVVLTPKASTVVKGVASGLRETITERALPAMMQWVRTQKPGESGVNIITADFVELGDFISTVIKLNYALDEGEDDTT
ncbi:PREDICTED: PI-PLC X domain-containing protein 3 [Nipponia nippon]|uniref:PI-PLC X domain-containing protein 3 n=1 Tax=Nipponia nippon TaxID=128390 RepID=UPI0005117318|nr:PREDICTED: PI-PLC X domain-containing protein 3 [Nipponia nippon]